MKYSEPESLVFHLRRKPTESGLNEQAAVEDHPAAVIRRIRSGLPLDELKTLADWLQITEDELAPMLGISRATLHRRRKSGRLESPESERLIRFARLMSLAGEVLDGEEAAREWLKAPAQGLDGEAPLQFADTEMGAREVENLLGRLEHGVFA